MRSHRHLLLASTPLALLLAFPAQAQNRADHEGSSDEIVITAIIPRSHTDVLGGTAILSGEQLVRDLRPNVGETLAKQPGVSATSFGPNASRPILRGFAGDRIRILTDGIGSFDVSATSVDHAVAINPLLAERIEVLHGPAALLYGSSAVGGVVNVIDSRIPTHMPKSVSLDAMGSYGSAADERSVSGRVDVPVGEGFVLHADGSYSKTGDLRTGGKILTPALRDAARSSGDAEIAELADLGPDLPNSAAESWSYAGGFAYVGGGGSIGATVSRLHNFYGVPIRYSVEPGGEAEQVRIRMNQTRADMRAQLPVNGALLDHINFRAGFADYEHEEIEESGEVGTKFTTQGTEARLELVQAKRGGWEGAVGGQLLFRKAEIFGDEKFLPATDSQTLGLFTLQSLDLGVLRLEAGARFEHNDIFAKADALLGNPDIQRRFDSFSGSLGASVGIAREWRIGVNVSRSERAPTADELFARGNHAGTQAFELGNPTFGKEKGWGVEATLHGTGTRYHVGLTAFYNRFNGFIYDSVVDDSVCEAANGGEPLEFPCFQYRQAPARYYGFELEGDVHLATIGGGDVHVDGGADYVRATIIGGGPVPRIPPLRLMGGLSYQLPALTARAEIEHDFEQDRVSDRETTTPAFTLVNASINWKPLPENPAVSLLLQANNIFDVVARRHASVLKDYAPLAGRDIRVTLAVKI